MKKIIFLLFIALMVGCTKEQQKQINQPATQSTNLTYKLSIKRIAPTWYFKRTMLVYQNGSWSTVKDSVSGVSSSYTFSPPSMGYSYQFSYNYTNNLSVDTNKIYQSDSIRMQILINGIVKKDTTVDGFHSGGTLTYFY